MKARFSLVLGVLSLTAGTLFAQTNYQSNAGNSGYSYSQHGMRMDQGQQGYRNINTQELRDALRSNPAIIVVDARTRDYENDARLPRAKFLPADSKDEAILATFPDRNAMIVVYCADNECVASHFLAKRLAKLGYRNVSRYADGIEGWKNSGNPTENPSSTRNAQASQSRY